MRHHILGWCNRVTARMESLERDRVALLKLRCVPAVTSSTVITLLRCHIKVLGEDR